MNEDDDSVRSESVHPPRSNHRETVEEEEEEEEGSCGKGLFFETFPVSCNRFTPSPRASRCSLGLGLRGVGARGSELHNEPSGGANRSDLGLLWSGF